MKFKDLKTQTFLSRNSLIFLFISKSQTFNALKSLDIITIKSLLKNFEKCFCIHCTGCPRSHHTSHTHDKVARTTVRSTVTLGHPVDFVEKAYLLKN